MPFWKGRGIEPNESRLRMARIPEGAQLIPNSVSAAPGFVVENVFVMAGVPSIMQAMMDEVVKMLPAPRRSFARRSRRIAARGTSPCRRRRCRRRFRGVRIGSYPYHDGDDVHDAAGAPLARRGGARRGESRHGGRAGAALA